MHSPMRIPVTRVNQESIGIQRIGAAQFHLKPFIIFRRQRPRKILWTNGEIVSNNKTRVDGMALKSQIIKQAPKTEQILFAGVVAQRRILIA